MGGKRMRLVAVAAWAVACKADHDTNTDEVDAAAADEVQPGSTTDAGDDVLSPTTSTEASGTTTSGELPWEHELHESCGDGVVEPGVVCYLPVPLPSYGSNLDVLGFDLDGDGDDEIIAAAVPTVASPGMEGMELGKGAFFQLDFDGTGWVQLALDHPTTSGVRGFVELGFDHDGDGRNDFILPNPDGLYDFRLHGDLVLSAAQTVDLSMQGPELYVYRGFHAADLEGDGFPEFVGALRNLLGPLHQVQLLRRIDRQWVAGGPPLMPFLPCGALEVSVRGDFDEDGDVDMFVYDTGQGCDPYPQEYDPSWYRYNILLNDREADALVLGEEAPIGGKPSGLTTALDFDEDGHLDIMFGIFPEDGVSGVILRGRGDGTFAEPERLYIDALPIGWRTYAYGDLFQLHHRSMLVRHDGDSTLYAVESPRSDSEAIPIMPSVSFYGSGDFNGDGLLDFVVENPNDPWSEIVMISYP